MKQGDSKYKPVKFFGCAFTSLIQGVKETANYNHGLTDLTLDQAYEICVEKGFISSDCFIYSYENILNYFDIDFVMTKYNFDSFDKNIMLGSNIFGLAFTKGHVELCTGLDEHNRIILKDPGYLGDTFIDDEGYFSNETKRSQYKGVDRLCTSIRIFECPM